MENYPAYKKYRQTRCAWLNEIPEHWGIKRLKNVASHNDEALDERTDPDLGIEYVDISSVSLIKGIEKTESMLFEKAPSRARRKVKHGDIIISTVRTYLKAIAPICKPQENMVVSTGFAVVRPKENLFSGFAGYLLQSNGFVGDVVANSTGVSYPAINASDLVRIPVVEPPLEEQKTITRFLDFKTAQIDALIEKKKNLLDKLTEKRTALISHAVTKGLDPSVKMTESGVPWLGRIPSHWRLLQLKYAVTFQRGHDLPSDARTEGEVPLVSSSGISSSHDVAIAKGPGIVTGRYGTIGKFTYVEPDYWPLNTTLYSVDTHSNNTKYLWFMMHLLSDLFVMESKKGAVPGVDRNDLHPVLTAVPPKAEQDAIVERLEKVTLKLDQQAEKIILVIDRLQEYRSTLITNAVTGKIDVRGFKIPQFVEGMAS